MRGGSKMVIIPHRHEGVFIAKGKNDVLLTKNMVPGVSVYGEKRISVQVNELLMISSVFPPFFICQSLSVSVNPLCKYIYIYAYSF